MAVTTILAGAADEHLTPSQLQTLIITERTGGSISLISVMLIFIAYKLVPRVRNVQNTFIVFASVSNVGASIASIIAMDGLKAGTLSPLCQAQSFMFEMFMQSDPWWSLAMAVNVFLVFYFRASPAAFQRWWWLYCLICYGGPFIFALTLLLVRDPDRPPVYGGATIWCWVDRTWDDIRIYTYYMLVWICIGGSLIFYFLVGYHVFRSRNQFRSFSTSRNSREDTQPDTTQISNSIQHTRLPSVPQDGGFYGTVITEVHVIHSKAQVEGTNLNDKRPATGSEAHVSFDDGKPNGSEIQSASSQYFSTVISSPPPTKPAATHKEPGKSEMLLFSESVRNFGAKFVVADPIKRAYLRTSFLFALSVLVTWIPSSLNRIHGWLSGSSPFGYHMASATVLPLQGLWNGIIFFVTSWSILRNWFRGAREERNDGGSAGRTINSERPEIMHRNVSRRDDIGIGSDSEATDAEVRSDGSEVELREVPGALIASGDQQPCDAALV